MKEKGIAQCEEEQTEWLAQVPLPFPRDCEYSTTVLAAKENEDLINLRLNFINFWLILKYVSGFALFRLQSEYESKSTQLEHADLHGVVKILNLAFIFRAHELTIQSDRLYL